MSVTTASSEEIPLIKLMLLGDTAVGKSSLLVRFCDGTFEDKHWTSIGIDFQEKVIQQDGRKLKVAVWDTAGQERFQSITPAFYRSAMGVLFCYDVTAEDSFKNVENWMKSLHKFNGPDVPTVLLGNKVDLVDERAVSSEKGTELANRRGISFFETSAKTGELVCEAFGHLAGVVAQQRYKDEAQPSASEVLKPSKPSSGSQSKCKC